MDDDAPAGRRRRTGSTVLLAAALAGVAALTLVPRGTGWEWGSPPDELRWYLTGLDSAATLVQLVGNLSLLVVPAALAVLRWPPLGRPPGSHQAPSVRAGWARSAGRQEPSWGSWADRRVGWRLVSAGW